MEEGWISPLAHGQGPLDIRDHPQTHGICLGHESETSPDLAFENGMGAIVLG